MVRKEEPAKNEASAAIPFIWLRKDRLIALLIAAASVRLQ